MAKESKKSIARPKARVTETKKAPAASRRHTSVATEAEATPVAAAKVTEKAPTRERGERYYEGVGRRKTAIARVRLYTKGTGIVVNEQEYRTYFPTIEQHRIVEDAFNKMKVMDKFRSTVQVQGGGIHAQAEAIRHGISRALVEFNLDFRKRLKKVGYLTRDPRAKERRKFGLKKARKAPQWAKR
jgi:small subunit ribosomal protein S9